MLSVNYLESGILDTPLALCMGHLLAEGQAKAKIEAGSQNTTSMTFRRKETLCNQKLP